MERAMIFGDTIYENTENILKATRGKLKEKLSAINASDPAQAAIVRSDLKKIRLLLGSLKRDMQVNDFMVVIRDGINELKHLFTDQELEQISKERSAMRQAIADQSIKAKIYFAYNGMTTAIREMTEKIKENETVKRKEEERSEPEILKDTKRRGVLINGEDVSDLNLKELEQFIRDQLGIKNDEIDEAKQSQFDFIMHHGAQKVYFYLIKDLVVVEGGEEKVTYNGYPMVMNQQSGTTSIHWKISRDGVSCVVENSLPALIFDSENPRIPIATYLTKDGDITDKDIDDDFKKEIDSTPPLIYQRLEYNLSTKKTDNDSYETSITNPSYSVSYHYGIDYSPKVDPGTSVFFNKVKGLLGQIFSWISHSLIGLPTQIEKALALSPKTTEVLPEQSPPSMARPEPPPFEPSAPQESTPATTKSSEKKEATPYSETRPEPPPFEPSAPEKGPTVIEKSTEKKVSDKMIPPEQRPQPPAWVPQIPKEKEEEVSTSLKDSKSQNKPLK
jgi:hypothetical protein